MTDDPARAIETMRQRLSDGEYDIDERDREALLDVSNRIRLLGPSEYSDHRHEFILRRNLILAKEVGGLADALADRAAAERVVRHINSTKNGSPETNKDYRVAFRAFGKLATEGDDISESIAWVPGGYPENYDPAPDPAEMLHWEADILPMVDACHNARDAALVTLAWDLGPRPSELFALTVDAISDHDYGKQVTIRDGKTGQRSPVLVPSAEYVRQWLAQHPGDGSDPLWCRLSRPDAISNNRVRDILRAVADRAGVDKPVTPSNFRKSSASYLASQGVSQAHLEDHHGWTRGSDIAARYIAVFDDAQEREIAAAHGIEVDTDDGEQIEVIPCPRCEQRAARSEGRCPRCGHALTSEAAAEAKQQRTEWAETLAQLDPEDAATVLEAADILDDPAVQQALSRD